MMTSTFGWCGSVNKRNFVPVKVWKHVRRKWEDSRTSMPVRWLDGMPREEGVRDFVIAWTLGSVSFDRAVGSQYGLQ